MSTFDDAQRFLDMRVAGWTDPEADVYNLLAELVASRDEASEGMYTQEEMELAVEEAESAREDWLDPKTISVSELLKILERRHEAEIYEERERAGAMPRRTRRKKKTVDPAAVAGESTPEENK